MVGAGFVSADVGDVEAGGVGEGVLGVRGVTSNGVPEVPPLWGSDVLEGFVRTRLDSEGWVLSGDHVGNLFARLMRSGAMLTAPARTQARLLNNLGLGEAASCDELALEFEDAILLLGQFVDRVADPRGR